MKTYKDYKWKIIASDFNSPFFRNYIWTYSPFVFPEKFDLPIPVLGIVSKENVISYVADMETWTEAHEAIKAKALQDFTIVEKLIDDTNSYGESFNVWSEKEIFQTDLINKSSEELLTLYEEFFKKQSMLYSYGIILPMLDFLGFSFVEKKVEDFLKLKVSESEFREYFDVITYPLHNSFAQDQEESLLRLMSAFYGKDWAEDINQKSNEEIKKKYPEFYLKLEEHAQKYAWVYYVYAGPAFTDKHFLDFIKDYISKGIIPEDKLAELDEKKNKAEQLREDIIKKLQPDTQRESFLRLAGKLVWAKPRRKDYQSRSYYHIEKLQREIAKRTFLSLSQVRSAPLETLKEVLKDNGKDISITNSIFKLHVCVPEGDHVLILQDQNAQEFIDKFMEKEIEQNYTGITEFKGSVASPGKKSGKVKIINRPEDMEKMEDGDVLVSVATTPSIVPAMRKASAIITDEGGLTCHAAIVSRELGITCVIGTKIATKVLKDGDLVEVDADNGVVRIIK